LLLFFSDYSIPVSRLTIPNPHEMFKLEGRNIIFEIESNDLIDERSLILKEGISNGILEVFMFLKCF
jgi:hypothetical protein